MAKSKKIFFKLECESWRPPRRLTVSQWADEHRILPPNAAEPGPWRTMRTPYLKGIMDAFNHRGIEEIWVCAATQVGKTEAILNMIGYAIDQMPAPILLVYPTEELAKFNSKNRIQVMINSCDVLKARKPANVDDFGLFEMHFVGGAALMLVGANSPSPLASRPIKYLFLDEIDKFPKLAGKEADPIELAKERTKTYWDRKVVGVSTPTLEEGNIWRAIQGADVLYRYYVPCPHCGHEQTFKFEQLKWPQELDEVDDVREAAWYECEKCRNAIYDLHKPEMLRFGRWKAKGRAKKIRHIGFHLPTFYSPWVSFGEIAEKFLKSKDIPEKLQNFINSWLAEPWREVHHEKNPQDLLALEMDYERGTVPKEAVALTAGVDVQEEGFWFVIRAWGSDLTSWLVLQGFTDTWESLERILFESRYPTEDGGEMYVEMACIDAGFRTSEVYRFVQKHYPRARATKGASHDMGGRLFQPPSKEARKQIGFAAPWQINTIYWKDFVSRRMQMAPGTPGAWHLYRGIDSNYLKQISSEVRRVKKGKIVWEKVSGHAQNHLWDAEVLAAVAQEFLNVRGRRMRAVSAEPQAQIKPQQTTSPRQSFWLPKRSGWLR